MEQYFNIISFITGIVSIVLGCFSIWISINSEKRSQALNDDTRNLLSQIKTVSESTHLVVSGEAIENSKHIRELNIQLSSNLINNIPQAVIESKTSKKK